MKALLRQFKKAVLSIHHRQVTIGDHSYRTPVLLQMATSARLIIDEPWMYELLKTVLKPGAVFLDIGANVGQTMLASKSAEPSVQYYGFEPNPACITYLQQLVNLNALENCTLFPVGLSDRSQISRLWVTKGNITSSGSTMENIKDLNKRAPHAVCTVMLDVLVEQEQLSQIDVMKIDVEGHEPRMLAGAEQTVAHFRPLILVELLPLRNRDDQARKQIGKTLENWRGEHNYQSIHIKKNAINGISGLALVESINGDHLESAEGFKFRDYLLVPQEIVVKFKNEYKHFF